jgi:hypothetical protein
VYLALTSHSLKSVTALYPLASEQSAPEHMAPFEGLGTPTFGTAKREASRNLLRVTPNQWIRG